MNQQAVCVLGEGAWGTAIALLLANNGYTVYIWCHHATVAEEIKTKRTNSRYLPGIILPESIIPITDFDVVLSHTQWIFQVIPVQHLRSVIERVKPYCKKEHIWVVLSKGIEQHTLLFPTQIIDAVLGYPAKQAVVAGPSFAQDLAHKKVTAVTLAADDNNLINLLQGMLANDYFKPYASMDVIGVQCAAALKNVITLGIGMLNGAGYADNTKAFFLTRGLHEIALLIEALGGKQETLYGLSGIGDLVLTAMSSQSRNLQVGTLLGCGESLDAIIQKTGYTPEGINTVVSVQQLAQTLGCDLPLCRSIHDVIYNKKPIAHLIDTLMK